MDKRTNSDAHDRRTVKYIGSEQHVLPLIRGNGSIRHIVCVTLHTRSPTNSGFAYLTYCMCCLMLTVVL